MFLMNDGRPAAGFQVLDKMLQEKERSFPGLDREILLHLRPLLPAEVSCCRFGGHRV